MRTAPSSLPVETCQSLTLPSPPAEAKVLPSGAKATARMAHPSPARRGSSFPVAVSQRRRCGPPTPAGEEPILSRGQEPAVGREGEAVDGISQFQPAQLFPRGEVPEAYRPVVAAGDERLAIRREGQAGDPPVVTEEAAAEADERPFRQRPVAGGRRGRRGPRRERSQRQKGGRDRQEVERGSGGHG